MGKFDHFAFLFGLAFLLALAVFVGADNNGWLLGMAFLFFAAIYVVVALFAPRKK